MNSKEQATEFSRRRGLPYVRVEYMKAGRSFDVIISLYGKTIGQKTETTTRGKVTSVDYFLPAIDVFV